jgi:hypothetical protein
MVQRWTPDQQRTTPQSHSALKTRVNALMALRSIRGTTASRSSHLNIRSGYSRLNIRSENCPAVFSNRVREARD